jgi:hypothetical protein
LAALPVRRAPHLGILTKLADGTECGAETVAPEPGEVRAR